MAHLHGKTGNVYADSLVIEDGEDAWTASGAGRTASTTTGKVGTNAARLTTVTIGATTDLMYEDFSSVNLTDYDALLFWFRSSVTSTVGQLQILLDDTSAIASPLESMNMPAYGTADTWQRMLVQFATPANLTAIISVGLTQIADLADGTFDLDDVRAVKIVDGAKDWSITYTGDVAEVTDYQSLGVKEYIAGPTGFTATWESIKDGAPLGFNSEVVLGFEEGTTVGQSWLGNAVIDGITPSVPIDGVVTYAYSATGTGDLESAVA